MLKSIKNLEIILSGEREWGERQGKNENKKEQSWIESSEIRRANLSSGPSSIFA